MKYITDKLYIQSITDMFPSLAQYKNSKTVKVEEYVLRNPIFLSNYRVVIIAVFGDYYQELYDQITRFANFKKDIQIVVPSTIKPTREFPSNVHWVTLESMYGVYVKDNHTIIKDRPTVQKHFVSLNNRITWFRQELFYYFYANNLLDQSYFSYLGNDRFELGSKQLFNECNNTIGANRYANLDIEQLYQQLPYTNFVESGNELQSKLLVNFLTVQDLYNTAGIAVETETYMEPFLDNNPGLTEKTFRPLAFGNPFLVYSNRGALALLKNMGFETYSNILDETYDTILNPQQRFEALLAEVTRISTMSITEVSDMLHTVEDVIEHNQNQLLVYTTTQLEQDEIKLNNLIRSLL